MKYFGTVNSFDKHHGRGSIKPETGGDSLGFDRSAIAWDAESTPPTAGQRLSYDLGTNSANKRCAMNLQTI